MTDEEFENYQFFRLFSVDFNSAQNDLKQFDLHKESSVRFSVLLSAIIHYSKPFSLNKGKLLKRHLLDIEFVPSDLIEMHNFLIKHRNQQFAHTDLEFNFGGIADFSTPTQKWFPMSIKRPPLIELDQKIETIKELVTKVEKRLNEEIEKIEVLLHKELQEKKAKNNG